MLPEWLQPVARAIPFTLLYELEREAFLKAAPLSELWPGVATLAAMVVAVWVGATLFFRAMLDGAKRAGRLGMY